MLARGRDRVRKELERLGIKRSHALDAPVWTLGFLLAAAVVAGLAGIRTHTLSAESAVGLAAVVLTVAGLLVAVLQWRHGLAEKAFDALYGRIALANQMRLEAFKDVELPEFTPNADAYERKVADEHLELYRFFVYTEIDSLEYAVRRYRSGLGLKADIVERAVRHFRGRCKSSPTFRLTAAALAEEGAYFDDTKEAVRRILKELELERPAR